MAKKKAISEFNQPIDVRKVTEVEQPDGNTKKNWDAVRFITKFANIKAASSYQHFSYGMSAKDTLYIIQVEFSPERAIEITDHILWNGRTLLPVGDCVITDFGNKRVFEQKAKYTSE